MQTQTVTTTMQVQQIVPNVNNKLWLPSFSGRMSAGKFFLAVGCQILLCILLIMIGLALGVSSEGAIQGDKLMPKEMNPLMIVFFILACVQMMLGWYGAHVRRMRDVGHNIVLGLAVIIFLPFLSALYTIYLAFASTADVYKQIDSMNQQNSVATYKNDLAATV